MRDGMSKTGAHRLRNIIGGSAGNLVEWYDWYIYAAFALYFAPVFFPEGDRTSQLLNTAAIFAVGFVMRPIGAWIMGVYADSKGRKAGLTLSVSLMCLGSLAIARDADLRQIGPLAPALLRHRADDPGPQPRRRIWAERDLSERDGGPRAARLLFELPICQPDRRPADRARRCCWCCNSRCRRRIWRPGAGGSRSPSAPCWRWSSSTSAAGSTETESFPSAQGGRRPDLERPQPVPRPSEGGAAGHGADRGRHAGLLRLHDLHAEIPGQHVGLRPPDGEPDDDRGPVRLHVPAAARRRSLGPGRAQAGDGGVRHARHDLHRADLHRARERARSVRRLRAGDGGCWSSSPATPRSTRW